MNPPSEKPSTSTLKGIRLFQSFSDQDLENLLNLGAGIDFEAHTNIVIEGESSWGVYIILNGLLGVYKANKLTGQSFDVGQLRTGNCFGEMSLIDENPRSASVKALTDVSLFFISKENFTKFLDNSNELKLKFFENCVRTIVLMLRELDENYVISQYQIWQLWQKSIQNEETSK